MAKIICRLLLSKLLPVVVNVTTCEFRFGFLTNAHYLKLLLLASSSLMSCMHRGSWNESLPTKSSIAALDIVQLLMGEFGRRGENGRISSPLSS